MTCGLLGSFYKCDKETHSDYLVLYDSVNYLYSVRTFALIFFFVTGSKSYLSICPNEIDPMTTTLCFVVQIRPQWGSVIDTGYICYWY